MRNDEKFSYKREKRKLWCISSIMNLSENLYIIFTYTIDVYMKQAIFITYIVAVSESIFLHMRIYLFYDNFDFLLYLFVIFFIQKTTAMPNEIKSTMNDSMIISTIMVCTMFSVMIVLVPTVLY